MSWSLRTAAEGDLNAIAEVHWLARQAYYAAAGQTSVVATADHRDAWRSLMGDVEAELTVAVDGTRVIGFIASGWSQDPILAESQMLELAALYVLPPYWGTGLAGQLHRAYLAHLERVRADAGVVDVWEGNARALAFYAKQGWAGDGRSRCGTGGHKYIGLRLARQNAFSRRDRHDPPGAVSAHYRLSGRTGSSTSRPRQ